MRRAVAVVVVSASVVVGCGSTGSGSRSVDQQLQSLYDEWSTAVRNRDADAFRSLTCPGLRSTVEPEAWFEDADKLTAIESIEAYKPLQDDNAAPTATDWRRLQLQDGGRLRVAKVDGTWYACER